MTNFVQLYKSTDLNAPTLSGVVGSLVTLLNKCLVDGYTTASVTLTQTGNVATATTVANTFVTGNYVTISGANEVDYNGTFQITVLNPTTFTFPVANSPASPATGTILYAKAGLGWSRPYTGTNAATYRSLDVTSNQFYLQINDNGATPGAGREAQAWGCELMTSYGGYGFRPFPNVATLGSGLSLRKSSTADATLRAWTLIGDDRTFYLIMGPTGDSCLYHLHAFGHFLPFRTKDGYCTFIDGEGTFNSAAAGNNLCTSYSNSYSSLYLARNYAGLASTPPGVSPITLPYVNASNLVFGATAGMAAPNGPDTGYYVMPVYIYESSTFRGRFPGLYHPMQANPLVNYDTMTNVAGLSGVTLTAVTITNTSAAIGTMLFDTFGPWT